MMKELAIGILLATSALGCNVNDTDTTESDTLLITDVSGDHPECGLRPEIVDRCDRNEDGEVDPEEIRTFLQERRDALLAEFDADENGRLDHTERQSVRESRRKERFDALDADSSGDLTPDEISDGCHAEARFDRLDADGDGVVSEDEFMDARWPRMRRRFRRGARRFGR